jgi:predicted MFS family arabinose efflux permease
MPNTDIRSLSLPRWLGGSAVQWSTAFAAMFFLTTICRTIVITILPIQGLAYLGDAQAVSVLFVVVSTLGVCTSVLLPVLVRRIRTRGVFHLAGVVAIVAPLLLGLGGFSLFLAGMVCWMFATLAFEVSLNLYIMHHIRRRDLAAFEPKRVLFMAIAYSVGPWLGIYLESRVAHWLPYLLTMLAAVATIAYFRMLGLRDAGARERLDTAPAPLRHVRRFAAQPRMRLAWSIALARSAWWATFFIYVPIYAVTTGLGEMAGGALVSIGVATVYTVTLWGKLGRRYGFRTLLVGGFTISAVSSIGVSVLAGSPWLGAGMLVFSAFCTSTIDGAGNMPFLRAVRPLEREEMAGVFSTYRDVSQLLPPALFIVILRFLPVHAVFGAAGLWMLSMAWFCRYLPRRL